MSTRIIAELGSCHMGKIERIKEAIDRCKFIGIDALKLQLFPNQSPYVPTNIYLSQEIFMEAFNYGRSVGLPVSASVFDINSWNFLTSLNPSFIKFAFSMKEKFSGYMTVPLKTSELIVSCDVMTDNAVPKGVTKLYCIPEYPVRYEVAFDGLFPRFDGFSDHTLGIRQTQRAIDAGAKIIEKHVRLGHADETCPDAHFAVIIEELGGLKWKS